MSQPPHRRPRRSPWLCLSLVLVLLIAAVACRPPTVTPGNGQPDEHQFLWLTLAFEPEPLDPQRFLFFDAALIINAVKEGLVRLGPDGSVDIGHGLAADIEVSEDGLTYDFFLHETTWDDATPLTAEDFLFAWLRAIDPRTATHHARLFVPIVGAATASALTAADDATVEAALDEVGIEVVDDRHLRVRLNQVTPHFLELLALPPFMPLNRALHGAVGDDYGTTPATTGSIGPFMLDEWSLGDRMRLVANPNYWDADSVQLEHVRFEFFDGDLTPAALLWDIDQLDAVDFVRGALAREHAEGGTLKVTDDAAVQYILFNLDDPGTSPSLRAALARSINRSAFAAEVLQDGSQPATSLTPAAVSGIDGQTFAEMVGAIVPLDPDPEIGDLLAAAADELNVQDISSIHLELITSAREESLHQAEALQGFWAQELGIHVEVRGLTGGQIGDRLENRDFQMMLIGWGGEFDDPLEFLGIWATGNDAGWEEPDFDALLADALGGSRDERLELLAEAERLLLEHPDQPVAPLYWWAWAYLEHEYVRDVIRRPFGGIVEVKWAYTAGRP